jgi:hypothetical protein
MEIGLRRKKKVSRLDCNQSLSQDYIVLAYRDLSIPIYSQQLMKKEGFRNYRSDHPPIGKNPSMREVPTTAFCAVQVKETSEVAPGLMQEAQRYFLLDWTDRLWQEHLQVIQINKLISIKSIKSIHFLD